MAIDLAGLVAPGTTALLFNEVQPSTVSGHGELQQAGAAILPNLVRLADAARASGVQVMHGVKIFRSDNLARNRNIMLYRLRGQVPDGPVTPDSRPVDGSVPAPELGLAESDLVMTRLHGMGVACDTGVVQVLRNLGITSVVVAGVSLNVGVTNTVMDLVNQAFEVIVPRDAVAGVPADYAQAMLRHTIGMLATLTTTDDLLAAWSSAPRS
jgi:biuret amidohydrolase